MEACNKHGGRIMIETSAVCTITHNNQTEIDTNIVLKKCSNLNCITQPSIQLHTKVE